jgi:hypothetical protein
VSVTPESVRAAIEAGDAERVRDLVVAATEKERREIRKGVDVWRYGFGSPKRFAAMLALCGTATARQVLTDWWGMDIADDRTRDLAYEVLSARGRDFFATVARGLVEDGVLREPLLVRRAVREGVLDGLPDEGAYARGLVRFLGNWRDGNSVYPELVADETLLDQVWGIFEVDCSTELMNAAEWIKDADGRFTSGRGENRWLNALRRLAAEGRLDRQRLLDESLGALTRDFRASMVGWYARLHEELEPTADERRARIDTYLALLASPVPSVVKEGLVGLHAIEAAVPPDELARAATGPLTQKQKNLAVDALGLLERAAKRDAAGRAELLDVATQALGHERADVQERALKLLERYPDESPRAALLGLAGAVSPTLRTRVEALTGVALEQEETAIEVRTPSPAQSPPPAEEPLHPVESVDELIELAASLLEGQGGGDEMERFLDGVSRLCGERPRGFERRTAGLVKQTGGAEGWDWLGGVGLVQVVVLSWVAGRRRPFATGLPDTLFGFLGRRALEVAARAAKRKARPLLAFPTHAGGRLDPDVLAEREQRTGRLLNRPDHSDALQAKLRALPVTTPISYTPSIVRQKLRHHEQPFIDLVATGLPAGLGPLAKAVAEVGRPHKGSIWLEPPLWGAWDTLGARWCLTVVPAHPEVSFAGAARLIAERLDEAPQLHPDVVLEHALDARVPLEGIAWLAVAGGLLAKSPDLQRLATDVVVASIADGRFDADGLARALAWLLDECRGKASRLEGPLRDAGRASGLHAVAVVRVTEALLASLSATPHGLQAPLEVMLDNAARIGVTVQRPEARAALERIGDEVSRSSKLGRVTRSLLELG